MKLCLGKDGAFFQEEEKLEFLEKEVGVMEENMGKGVKQELKEVKEEYNWLRGEKE